MMKLANIILISLLVTGCNEADIAGSADKKFVGTTKPKDCDTTLAKTKADLLTSSLRKTTSLQSVEYELTLLDCEGEQIELGNSVVLFDLNLYFKKNGSSEIADLPYEIHDLDGKLLNSGELQLIRGKDLFGVVEKNRFHWRSEGISGDTDLKKVRFKVSFSGYDISNIDTSNPGELASFLKIGQAEELQKNILFND